MNANPKLPNTMPNTFVNDENFCPVMATPWLVAAACQQIAREPLDQQSDMIEGLWNWIDCQGGSEPEDCWKVLMEHFPNYFAQAGNANSCMALGGKMRRLGNIPWQRD